MIRHLLRSYEQPALFLYGLLLTVTTRVRPLHDFFKFGCSLHLRIFNGSFSYTPDSVICNYRVTTLRSGLCCRRSFCLSVVCLSVTLVHPNQGLNLSAMFLHICVPWPSSDLRAKFYGDRPRGTHSPGALNTRGVAK